MEGDAVKVDAPFHGFTMDQEMLKEAYKPAVLEDVFPMKLWKNMLEEGYLHAVPNPDGVTTMYYTAPKAEDEEEWNEVTMNATCIIVRRGEIIARAPRRFFLLDSPDFPETMLCNLPNTACEITEWIDGHMMLPWTSSKSESKYLTAGKQWLQPRELTIAAIKEYRKFYINSEWPTGYTPVFSYYADQFRKVARETEGLRLVALVNNLTGDEATYGEMSEWAKFNDMLPVLYSTATKAQALEGGAHAIKGYVLKWNAVGSPPLRVGVLGKGYKAICTVLNECTPKSMAELLGQGAELAPLYKDAVPEGFRDWAHAVEFNLRMKKLKLETHALDIYTSCKDIPTQDRLMEPKEKTRAVKFFQERCREIHCMPLMSALVKMINKKPAQEVEAAVWEIVATSVEKERGYAAQNG